MEFAISPSGVVRAPSRRLGTGAFALALLAAAQTAASMTWHQIAARHEVI
jgi:hypothetical protein